MTEDKKPQSSISQQVLDKIEAEHVQPKPQWQCLLQRALPWSLFGAAVIIGSVGVAASLAVIQNERWVADDTTIWRDVLSILPLFWLVVVLVFVGIALYQARHTERGYRYKATSLIGLTVLLSFAIGSLLYAVGGGDAAEEFAQRRMPGYPQMVEHRLQRWAAVSDTRMTGFMISVVDSQIVEVYSLSDKSQWLLIAPQPLDRKTQRVIVEQPFGPIRFFAIGQVTGEYEFTASEVRVLPPGNQPSHMNQAGERKLPRMRIER